MGQSPSAPTRSPLLADRPMAVAGRFYPGDPAQLAQEVDNLLAGVKASPAPLRPKAVVAPHAGLAYSGPTAAHAFAPLARHRDAIHRVVVLGPSHRLAFRGLALSGTRAYDSPLGPVPVDHSWQDRLSGLDFVGRLEQAHGPEHALEVELPFLQRILGPFSIVPIVCGEAAAEEVAQALERVWGGPETLIVVSSDLSHYLEYEEARRQDGRTATAIARLDSAPIGPREACGHVPLGGLLCLARVAGMTTRCLDLRNSGDTAGPRDRVVGYGAWAFYDPASVVG
ncbi:AmmeMemoRadiSam system protein B [Rhodospirillum rubrum]|uniref:AmmeMemoRadiSam system protein B n=1 Tax=Rhodospirillum rubrum TaxID=1085 RepID=UPI0019059C18|nr:AmmeMemoRadiSam system protein B [Rhodospirillum rubrum]MBK1663392.1 AmmeMemoRadiSam system protein B [Rhodospirillum rubrum]MBK1675564.1 AmmeMemoRadiSam system protein B [Rhodospirillum rubrum]